MAKGDKVVDEWCVASSNLSFDQQKSVTVAHECTSIWLNNAHFKAYWRILMHVDAYVQHILSRVMIPLLSLTVNRFLLTAKGSFLLHTFMWYIHLCTNILYIYIVFGVCFCLTICRLRRIILSANAWKRWETGNHRLLFHVSLAYRASHLHKVNICTPPFWDYKYSEFIYM